MEKILSIIFVTILLFSTTTIITAQKATIKDNFKEKNQNNQNSLLSTDEDIIITLLEQLDEPMLLGYIEDLVAIAEAYESI